MAKTVKVAILGGGMAGVAAAWTLVHAPPGDVRYEVTIYEATFRLGGKCASGRNTAMGNRIEEHGIHILMGFYSQMLRILRDVYAEVDPALGFGPFDQALDPGDELQLPELVNGTWTFWDLVFPTNADRPGDADPERRDILGALVRAVKTLAGWVAKHEAALNPAQVFSAKLHAHAAVAPSGPTAPGAPAWLAALGPMLEGVLANVPDPATLTTDLRHLWMAIWFGATNLLGILRDGLWTREAFLSPTLNAQDYKAWLKSVGGSLPSPELTHESPIVNAIYDLVFSRAVGFAAGAALYDTILMLLLYAGHVYYRMAGMGDVVFAPLYFALAAKGVRFRFEHTVTDVKLGPAGADGRPAVTSIELSGDGQDRSVPELFLQVHGKYCWPTVSLVNRPTHPITLGPGDFDYVVSAIPVGALASSAPSLLGLPAIANGVAGMQTVPTQSIQLWLDQTNAQLGWPSGRMMLGSFARPFNSCADMAQCLPIEDVPGERAVLYMSDVYTGGTTDPVQSLAIVKQEGIGWVQASLPRLLPQFTWDHLIDPNGGLGSHRFDAQYYRANVTGSELYVASKPGTVALRPAADGSGASNLLLASDWVLTEENAGCVEGAARSGVKAAEALIGLAAMPGYVQNDGDWVFPGPVKLANVDAQVLPFLADGAALAALCASHAIGGCTIAPWLPAFPVVLVFAAATDAITSLDPVYATWGSLSEREVGVFVPVRVTTPHGGTFGALLCPYLYVDNGAAAVAGREIYGLPKELASFPAWPAAGPIPDPLIVTSLAIPAKGDLARQQTILSIKTELALPPLTWDPGAILKTFWADLAASDASVLVVALKQFHAVEDGRAACYQRLVRFRIAPTIRSVALEGGLWKLSLPPAFFPQPGTSLGVADGSHTLVAVKASLDFTLTLGEVLA